MPRARPEILRRFYQRAWGAQVPEGAVEGAATFDEYFALQRVQYPGIDRHTAAKNATIARFRKLADEIEPRARPEIRLPKTVPIARQQRVDLADAAVPRGTQKLILDRIKALRGFAGLARMKGVEEVALVLCYSPEAEGVPARRAALRKLTFNECNPSCLRSALRATSAAHIEILHLAESTLDLRLLDGHRDLRFLRAGGPVLRGSEHLARMKLVELHLGGVVVDGALRAVLERLAPRLEALGLTADATFAPAALPDLSRFEKLQRFTVGMPGREHAEAWIDVAVAHPSIDFRFMIYAGTKPPRSELVEIHRGVDILRVEGPKKKKVYEVAGDLAAMIDAEGNNGDLEDRAMAAARAAKKKLTFSSEADTFVAQALDVETCRWVIDAVLDGAARGAADVAAKPAASKPRKVSAKRR